MLAYSYWDASIADIGAPDGSPVDGPAFFKSVSFRVLATVPEPATWAMMLLGLFGLGAALRTGRRCSARAGAYGAPRSITHRAAPTRRAPSSWRPATHLTRVGAQRCRCSNASAASNSRKQRFRSGAPSLSLGAMPPLPSPIRQAIVLANCLPEGVRLTHAART
jgi:PEP-CTERM motif-containing protein